MLSQEYQISLSFIYFRSCKLLSNHKNLR